MTQVCVIVTDGETRAALATVRSLGAAGHAVHVVSAEKRSLAGASRHARAEHRLPDPAVSPGAWAEALEELADRVAAELILPVAEVSLGALYAHGIQDRRAVACPSREAYEIAVDKHALLTRAAELGLPVPRGELVPNPGALSELPAGFAYPVVLKARRSRFRVGDHWEAGGVRIVHGPEDLAAAREDPGLRAGALLQEFVPGGGEAVFLIASEGRTRAAFAHRRLREKPPSGGVSVLCESIAPDPELLAGSERLLGDLAWTGVAMVEFRRAPDGSAALMEVNPRLWGSLQLAVDAGVDFPSLMLALYRGQAVDVATPRLGVRSRWLLGDLDHLLSCLRRPAMRAATGRGAARVLGDFLRSFGDGSRLEVCRLRDGRPFLRELRGWVVGLVAGQARRARRLR